MAGSLIFACALIYRFSGDVIAPAGQSAVSFFDALYMSVITFTTVGYGDFLPSGWIRGIAMLEALSGIVLTPLFLVGLTRRYLRMYR